MRTRRDLVAVGGSAGGFTALKTLLSELPAGLDAAVFVTLHFASHEVGRAVDLLATHSALPLRTAEDEQPIERGTVTFAPSDAHLLLGPAHVHLRRGPRENGFRPAIDPMLRSAAVHGSTRTIGVVLSGLLDDGASGLRAVRRQGGAALVQAPGDADFPDMPTAALAAVPDAEALPLGGLAARISDLVGRPVPPVRSAPADLLMELKIAGLENATMATEDRLGTLSPYNCPDCNGVLWEIDDGAIVRFRCHTGHAYTLGVLTGAQREALERSLYETLRAHRGHASVLHRMAEGASSDSMRRRYRDRATGYEEDAALLERIILERGPSPADTTTA